MTETSYSSLSGVAHRRYALALPCGDAIVDRIPLRTFLSDASTGADVGRYNHRVGDLVLHPAGSLIITQRAVPLGITLDKFGAQKPEDANLFSVAVTTTGLERRSQVMESFATAQFHRPALGA